MTFLQEHRSIELEVYHGEPRDHISAIAALWMDAAIIVRQPAVLGCLIESLWLEFVIVASPTSQALAPLDALNWKYLKAERFLVSRVEPGPEGRDYIVEHARVALVMPRLPLDAPVELVVTFAITPPDLHLADHARS